MATKSANKKKNKSMKLAKGLKLNRKTLLILAVMFGLGGGLLLYTSRAATPNIVKNPGFESAVTKYIKPRQNRPTTLYSLLPQQEAMKKWQWHFYVNPTDGAPVAQKTGVKAVDSKYYNVDASRIKTTKAHGGDYVMSVIRRNSGNVLGYRGIAQQVVAFLKTTCSSKQDLKYQGRVFTHYVSGASQYLNVKSYNSPATAWWRPEAVNAVAQPTPPSPPAKTVGTTYDQTYYIAGASKDYWRETQFSGFVSPKANSLIMTVNSDANSQSYWDDFELGVGCVDKPNQDTLPSAKPPSPSKPPVKTTPPPRR